MKKIIVNEDACIGCGSCVAIDPTHFDFNEDGLSEVISNNDIDTDDTRNAIASCPTNAIYVSEDECSDDCNCGDDCNCNSECNCGCDCCK